MPDDAIAPSINVTLEFGIGFSAENEIASERRRQLEREIIEELEARPPEQKSSGLSSVVAPDVVSIDDVILEPSPSPDPRELTYSLRVKIDESTLFQRQLENIKQAVGETLDENIAIVSMGEYELRTIVTRDISD